MPTVATITPPSPNVRMERVTLTPEFAERLLEYNKSNRPIRDGHVQRIAAQITSGKWRFNGDTIKISSNQNVLDGQHRLWAVLLSKRAVESIIVWGIPDEAFSTMDTIRSLRSGADVLSRVGVKTGRQHIATAIKWMLRWQRGTVADYRQPGNRIENSDVEAAWGNHKGLARAVERVSRLRTLCNPGLLAVMFYVISNRDPYLAERMVTTLENPAGASINDPFFRLRAYFLSDKTTKLDPVMTIALIIKAANVAKIGGEIKLLRWANQGEKPEMFPELDI